MTKDDDIFVSAIIGTTDAYREGAGLPRLDRVCPYCGVKHQGPWQACSPCKSRMDSGMDCYPDYAAPLYRKGWND